MLWRAAARLACFERSTRSTNGNRFEFSNEAHLITLPNIQVHKRHGCPGAASPSGTAPPHMYRFTALRYARALASITSVLVPFPVTISCCQSPL